MEWVWWGFLISSNLTGRPGVPAWAEGLSLWVHTLGWGFPELSQAHLLPAACSEWCCLIFTVSLGGEALVQWGVGFQPSPAALLESHSSSREQSGSLISLVDSTNNLGVKSLSSAAAEWWTEVSYFKDLITFTKYITLSSLVSYQVLSAQAELHFAK